MAKNDQKILREFTRLRKDCEGIVIEVCVIDWGGRAYAPESSWVQAARLPPTATRDEVSRTHRKLLHRRRFFGKCKECGERNPRGWMQGDICQGCAEGNHGVVH